MEKNQKKDKHRKMKQRGSITFKGSKTKKFEKQPNGGAPISQNFNQIKDLESFPIGHARPPNWIGDTTSLIWGCSSAGRAPALQAGGQEFDPPHLHQRFRKTKSKSHKRHKNHENYKTKRKVKSKISKKDEIKKRQFTGHISRKTNMNKGQVNTASGECLGTKRRRRTW